jgi:hypothetical protein
MRDRKTPSVANVVDTFDLGITSGQITLDCHHCSFIYLPRRKDDNGSTVSLIDVILASVGHAADCPGRA